MWFNIWYTPLNCVNIFETSWPLILCVYVSYCVCMYQIMWVCIILCVYVSYCACLYHIACVCIILCVYIYLILPGPSFCVYMYHIVCVSIILCVYVSYCVCRHHIHTCIQATPAVKNPPFYIVGAIQGGVDSQDALSCRSFSAKESQIIGLFLRKMTYENKTSYATMPPCTRVRYAYMYGTPS